jgi:Flp pilus assembly pilin Flp
MAHSRRTNGLETFGPDSAGPKVSFSARAKEVGMNRCSKMLRGILTDETGGEVIEYALILGLIAVACIVIIGNVGTRVLARWGSVNSSM